MFNTVYTDPAWALRPRAAGESNRAKALNDIDALYEKVQREIVKTPSGPVRLVDLVGRTSWFHNRENVDADFCLECKGVSPLQDGSQRLILKVYSILKDNAKEQIGEVIASIAYLDNRPVVIIEGIEQCNRPQVPYMDIFRNPSIAERYENYWSMAALDYMAAVAKKLGVSDTYVIGTYETGERAGSYYDLKHRHEVERRLSGPSYHAVSYGKGVSGTFPMRKYWIENAPGLESFFDYGPHFSGVEIIGFGRSGIWTILKVRPKFDKLIPPQKMHLIFSYINSGTGPKWSESEAIWDAREEAFLACVPSAFIAGTFKISHDDAHLTWAWSDDFGRNITREQLEKSGVVMDEAFIAARIDDLYYKLNHLDIETPGGSGRIAVRGMEGHASWFHDTGEVDVNISLITRGAGFSYHDRSHRLLVNVFPHWRGDEFMWGDGFLKTSRENFPNLEIGSIGRLLASMGYVNGAPAVIVEEVQATEAFEKLAISNKEVVRRYDLYWILAGLEYLASVAKQMDPNFKVYLVTFESAKKRGGYARKATQGRRMYHEPGVRLGPARKYFVSFGENIQTLEMHPYPMEKARAIAAFSSHGPRFSEIRFLGVEKEGGKTYLRIAPQFSPQVPPEQMRVVLVYGDPSKKDRWQEEAASLDQRGGYFRARVPRNFIEGTFKISLDPCYETWRWTSDFGNNITRPYIDSLPVIRRPAADESIHCTSILRPRSYAARLHDTPKHRALILLEELRKEFVTALRDQTDIILQSNGIYLEQTSVTDEKPTVSRKYFSKDNSAREIWASTELRRLISFSQRIFNLSGRAIAVGDRTAILSLIKHLDLPLSNRDLREVRRVYNQEILPALDRLISQYIASSPLEQMRAAETASDLISSSLLRPRAAGER